MGACFGAAGHCRRPLLGGLLLTLLATGCRPDPPYPPLPMPSPSEAAEERPEEAPEPTQPPSEVPAPAEVEPVVTPADRPETDRKPKERRQRRQPPAFEQGLASWYGPGFHGNRTANGERYDMDGISAAHKTLPFDTVVEVHNLDNGRRLEVRINDRGPFIDGRIIDLSRGAARKLDLVRAGVARVELRLVSSPAKSEASAEPTARHSRIQVAAFRQREHATALARRLRDERSLKRWVEIQRGDGWHRVRLIDVPSKQVASALERLRALGFDPFVLR